MGNIVEELTLYKELQIWYEQIANYLYGSTGVFPGSYSGVPIAIYIYFQLAIIVKKQACGMTLRRRSKLFVVIHTDNSHNNMFFIQYSYEHLYNSHNNVLYTILLWTPIPTDNQNNVRSPFASLTLAICMSYSCSILPYMPPQGCVSGVTRGTRAGDGAGSCDSRPDPPLDEDIPFSHGGYNTAAECQRHGCRWETDYCTILEAKVIAV